MNNQPRRWEIIGKIKTQKANLKTERIIDVLLSNRGIKTLKEKKEFFRPTSPEDLTLKELGISAPEVRKALLRLKKALKNKEKVIVYGDYDADGICGTAILWETLYSLGLDVLPHIPERFTEGYGLNIESIKKLKKEDDRLGLIITFDHGIVANKKVDFARELGIDIIISDHHEPGKIKPKPLALVHTTKISGSAVAWVLAREIRKGFKIKDSRLKSGIGLDLAAIGTIADQLPLIGPNRSFAKHGLESLNKTSRPGLLALLDEAGLKGRSLGPYEIGFVIAPRINAMGRLSHAIDSLRLLCTPNREQARELAGHLGRTNTERQRIVEEVVLHARGAVGKTPGMILLAHESYHEGVIGLAAARLVEEFYRPAIVFSKKADISKASARSISGFNIIEIIRKLEDLYIEGGGHPMAAGFSIKTAKLEEFNRKIQKISAPLLTPELLERRLRIDLEIHFIQLNRQLLSFVKLFEPTGLKNPSPTFVTRSVKVVDARLVGKEATHLKLKLIESDIAFDAIGFGLGKIFPKLGKTPEVDVVYNLEENEFNGTKTMQLKLKDIRFAS